MMRNNFLLMAVPAILILAAVAGGTYMYRQAAQVETNGDMAAHDLADVATVIDPSIIPAAGDDVPSAEETVNKMGLNLDMAQQADTSAHDDLTVVVEGNDPKAPRTIGSIDAPVTMLDFSSLTCPHCAKAHQTVLPQLIKDYVETGKLRIVFSDFPLNEQALDASKVARCMPNEQYFSFLTMLFSSIDQWAYSNSHPDALIQNAVLAGLPEDKARECLNDKELETAIMKGLQDAAQKYQVSATPTFVLNDGAKTISGARPYEDFKAAIDPMLPASE